MALSAHVLSGVAFCTAGLDGSDGLGGPWILHRFHHRGAQEPPSASSKRTFDWRSLPVLPCVPLSDDGCGVHSRSNWKVGKLALTMMKKHSADDDDDI